MKTNIHTKQLPDVSASFFQPFIDYTTKGALTFELTSEDLYDWKSEQWSVPVYLTATQLTQIGSQLVSVGGGIRYWVKSTDFDPEGWSANASITLLFP